MEYNLIGVNPKNASAIIAYYKNNVLLNLRSNKEKIFYPNYWGLFGGAKYKNENYLGTAIREFEEETKISLNKKKIKFFIKILFTFPSKNKLIYRYYYLYNIDNVKKFNFDFSLNEGASYSFMNFNQIKKISNIVPYDKFALDLFFNYRKKYSNKK